MFDFFRRFLRQGCWEGACICGRGDADALSELGVAAPVFHEVKVYLGPVERFFYQRQQRRVGERLCGLGSRGSNATAGRRRGQAKTSSLQERLLLALRLACIHPQLGSLGLKPSRGGSASSTSPSTTSGQRRRGAARERRGGDLGFSSSRAELDAPAPTFMSMGEVLVKLVHDARVGVLRLRKDLSERSS